MRKKKLEKEQGDHIENHYPQDENRITFYMCIKSNIGISVEIETIVLLSPGPLFC
jgi:hypothetical protein